MPGTPHRRTGTTPPFGYRQFHPDVSLNFECNRWAEWIGPSAISEVAGLAAHANSYPEWISGFLGLGGSSPRRRPGLRRGLLRPGRGDLHDRDDPHRMPRATGSCRPCGPSMPLRRNIFRLVPARCPVDLRPQRQSGPTIVMFGGFDSYIEEFAEMAAMVAAGAASSPSKDPAKAAHSRTTGCR